MTSPVRFRCLHRGKARELLNLADDQWMPHASFLNIAYICLSSATLVYAVNSQKYIVFFFTSSVFACGRRQLREVMICVFANQPLYLLGESSRDPSMEPSQQIFRIFGSPLPRAHHSPAQAQFARPTCCWVASVVGVIFSLLQHSCFKARHGKTFIPVKTEIHWTPWKIPDGHSPQSFQEIVCRLPTITRQLVDGEQMMNFTS